jgi:Cu-Zn family superoxide dismutase
MKTRAMVFTLLASVAALATMAGCAGMNTTGGAVAAAKLEATIGNAVSGTVTFRQNGDQVAVHAVVEGLKVGQEHGFHIHEKGDCSSGDGMSTGGHFNPTGKAHGAQDADHHAGDLPALKADAQGRVDVTFVLAGVGVGSGAADIVGKGLIVHALPDDYRTQPTGNSGARIACGVISRQ